MNTYARRVGIIDKMKKENEIINTKITMKKINALDVAKIAGVSQSTVSRVFSSTAKVSPETREKILKVAKEIGYKPNAIARSLISSKTNIIGIVMANSSSPFYSNILKNFTNKLQQMGKQVLLFNISINNGIDDILTSLYQYRVDGLIVTSASVTSDVVDECLQNEIPIVLFNRYVPGAFASAVCCDNVEAGREIANYLLDNGRKKFAYISGNGNASTNIDRLKGFKDRLNERGINNLILEYGDYSYKAGREAAMRLMKSEIIPDCIFCANDNMAIGAMDMIRYELDYNIPHDVAIVGFDDIPAAEYPSYKLTTYRQPIEKMVNATVELLEKRLENIYVEPTLKLIHGKLIERKSV